LIHDLRGIVGVFLGHELYEAETLVDLSDTILGKVDVLDAPSLEHQLPHELVGDALIEIAYVDGGLLVLFPTWVRSCNSMI
jgi:hypothetical protein